MKRVDIKEIQDLIISKGLENELMFRDVMKYSTTEIDNKINYYKSVKGKYFKSIHDTLIEYHYVHDDIKRYETWHGTEDVIVKEDNYTFGYSGGIRYYEDLDHCVSNTNVGRYDDCIEISKEEFDMDMLKISTFVNDGKNLLKNLISNGN